MLRNVLATGAASRLFKACLAPILALAVQGLAINSTIADDSPEFGILLVAPGVEETFYACTACHSEMIIAQQGLTRKKWDETFEWMVEEQGMDEIEEPDRTAILDYLSKHYNEDRPNFPRR